MHEKPDHKVTVERHRIRNGIIAFSVLVVAGVGITSSCDTKFTEPFKDAPRSHRSNMQPMDVINGSDGFSNVGSKCDGYGGRIYMAYHADAAYAAIAVKSYSELAPDDPCRNYRSK